MGVRVEQARYLHGLVMKGIGSSQTCQQGIAIFQPIGSRRRLAADFDGTWRHCSSDGLEGCKSLGLDLVAGRGIWLILPSSKCRIYERLAGIDGLARFEEGSS
jgi:hypothetical protein